MPFLPPHGVDPGRSPVPRCAPFARSRLPAVDAQTHWFHTGVHRLCTAGDGMLPGLAPHPDVIGISTGQTRVRDDVGTVRWSGDRQGRPARRNPDVRRGATATLTAPSTARQRSSDSPGRVASGVPPPPRARPGGSSAVAIPPALGIPRFLRYAGRRLWAVPPPLPPPCRFGGGRGGGGFCPPGPPPG